MAKRCEKTGVVIGYNGPQYGNGHMIHSLVYLTAVHDGLRKAGLWVSAEWAESQYHRIMLHRDMGFLPDQSVEELRPFAEAQLAPHRYDPAEEMRDLMELARKTSSEPRNDGEMSDAEATR